MSDWNSQSLRALIGWPISGKRPAGGVSTETEGVPSLGGENVLSNGGTTFENLNRVPRWFYQAMPKGHLKPNDVIINKDGAQTGKVGLYGGEFEEACVNEHLYILRDAYGQVDQRFLYYSVLSQDTQRKIARRITGSAQPGLNSGFVDAVSISLPSTLTEQRRIATILTTLDEVIEATEKLVEKHQQIKAGLMHDLFTRGVTPDGNLRPTSEARKSKFGWIPKSWRVGSLLDVASPTRQPILTGPFGADLGTGDFVEAGVPLLRIGNVQTGRLDLENLLFVSERKATLLDRYRVREGDLLFARQGATTGRNTLATAEVEGWLINYHIIRVALDHSLCSPFFIETAFNSDVVKKQIERDKGRGTREGINSAQLRCLELPLADFEEQQMITQILGSNQSLLKKSQDNLAKLRQQKQGLMHDLLTSRVRVDGISQPQNDCQP